MSKAQEQDIHGRGNLNGHKTYTNKPKKDLVFTLSVDKGKEKLKHDTVF